jgi:hypothetical protein
MREFRATNRCHESKLAAKKHLKSGFVEGELTADQQCVDIASQIWPFGAQKRT